MKRFLIIPLAITLVTSIPVKGQKNYKNFHGQKYCSNNLNFAGGFIAGLFLSEAFNSANNKRYMFFKYNYKTSKWRLVEDSYKYEYGYRNRPVEARFENPNGGRDFFVKISRRGNWFIDAPRKFKGIISKKVKRNL